MPSDMILMSSGLYTCRAVRAAISKWDFMGYVVIPSFSGLGPRFALEALPIDAQLAIGGVSFLMNPAERAGLKCCGITPRLIRVEDFAVDRRVIRGRLVVSWRRLA